ncbi:MAG: DUF4258 domain-containing protein [Desulfosporosinus sp.]
MVRSPEESIRSCALRQQLNFSDHALDRMGERQITIDQVYDCAMYGLVIETQDHGEDIKVIFQEPTNEASGFYVVIADSSPFSEVITVCLTRDEAWDTRNGLLRRRS